MIRKLVFALSALVAVVVLPASAAAQNLGVTVLLADPQARPANAPEHRPAKITLFHDTSSTEQTVERGLIRFSAADRAEPPAALPRPLVLVSHGSGGTPWTFADLARRLVRAGFVVAVPEHRGDNANERGDVGPPSWRRRPLELSATLDVLAADPVWSMRVDVQRVGVFGMSAGGHTALVMAGGVWSAAAYGDHCRRHLADDFNTCVGLLTYLDGGWLDSLKLGAARLVLQAVHRDGAALSHADPRVRAVVASVPMAAPFDPASLARPRVPLAIMRAELDRWLVPRFHSDAILAACLPTRACTLLADWPKGGHGSVLSPFPPELASRVSQLMVDPEGFDRAVVLPAAFDDVTAFFLQHVR